MDKTIVIEYQTQSEFCSCCDQILPKPKISGVKEFELSEDNLSSYQDWKEAIEFDDDFNEMVREYVYDTIRFFATSSDDRIIIENREFEKVKQFILGSIKS
ncbi:hypothetical protein ACFYKX_26505 [Cytobacillus sp. FJAT-54145]|uniref:Uncharacterized protein n=1 Tax=Cytobacillus spartinae TaxID=3299023 RepID=A0ABW6KK53_9BACI